MFNTKYNALIDVIVSKQKLIDRHSMVVKQAEKELMVAMKADNKEVFQGKKGIATYKKNTSNTTDIDMAKLYKKLKISVFLKLVKYNATQAKPLIASGEIDSKLIDAVTSTGTKSTPAKLKVTAL